MSLSPLLPCPASLSFRRSAAPLVLVLLFLGGVFPGLSTAQATNATQPATALSQAVRQEIEAQRQAGRWTEEKQAVIQKLLDLKTRLAWTEFKNRQLTASTQRTRLELERVRQENENLKALRRHLAPSLETVIEELATLVENDLAFLESERRDRLAFLRQSVLDAELDLATRLDRVLQGLLVEASYAGDIALHTTRLERGTASLQVRLLRLGRLGKYYLSLDGSHGGWWDAREQQWRDLPGSLLPELRRAYAIAEDRAAAEFVSLPLPHSGSAAEEDR